MVKGIGPIYARKLVHKFGEKIFDIIENYSARLEEVEGIGTPGARRSSAAGPSRRSSATSWCSCTPTGCQHQPGGAHLQDLRGERRRAGAGRPLPLARDIHGIGFLSADTIAQKLGVANDSPQRAQAGVSYALTEASAEGHCGLPHAELVDLAVKLLDIPAPIIEEAIRQQLTEETVIADTVAGQPCVFLAPLYHAERAIAAHVGPAANGRLPVAAVRRRPGHSLGGKETGDRARR